MLQHGRKWLSQVPSRLFALSACQNSSKYPVGKSYAMPSLGLRCSYFSARTKVNARRLHQVDWLFIISPGQLVKPWFQTTHWRHARHAAVCILTGVRVGEVYWVTQDILSHPKGAWTEQSVTGPQRVTWPSDRPGALWTRLFGQRFGVESSKSILYFGIGNRWSAGDAKMGNRRTSVCCELYTLFPFLSLFSSLPRIPMAHCNHVYAKWI